MRFTHLGQGDLQEREQDRRDAESTEVVEDTRCHWCGEQASARVRIVGEAVDTDLCPECHAYASDTGSISNEHVTVLLPEYEERVAS